MGRQDEIMSSTPGGRSSSGKRHSELSHLSQTSNLSQTTTTPVRQVYTPTANSTTATSSQKSLPNDSFAGTEREQPVRKLTAYEKLTTELNNDARVLKEITLGKRIAFYRIRGELGSGNFSQVKMGIHALTKGK